MEAQSLFHLLGFQVNITKNAFFTLNQLQIPQAILKNNIRFLVNKDDALLNYSYTNMYLSDRDILFSIRRLQKDFIFTEITGVDISNQILIRKGMAPKFQVNEPIFFRRNVDDKKVYLNKNVIQELRRFSINPQDLSYLHSELSDGFYSMYDDELQIVVFFYTQNGNQLILKIAPIDYIKTGVAYSPTVHLKKLAQF